MKLIFKSLISKKLSILILDGDVITQHFLEIDKKELEEL